MDERSTSYAKRLSLPWQLRSLSYYDTIGEIGFTSKFLARQISRVRFYPALRNDEGIVEPITSGPPVDVLSQIQDPGGGTSQFQFDYGRLMFTTGEGVLFGYDEGTRWKFLWKDEVKRMDDGSFRRVNTEMVPTDEVGVAYRIWSPHPRHSDEPDSPMRSVQDICELILILTLGQRSTALTRMTKGIMWIPQEFDFAPIDPGLDEDPQQNPFMADMMEHFANQIENPGSAAANVPFVGQVPGDHIQQAEWMKTHDPATDYQEKDSLEFQIKRLALSLDMSPEDLLGYTNANHWTGRQVQLDRWRMFGFNKAELWAQSLSDAYLRPALREMEYPGWENVVIAFDDSQVVISPDRTEDALTANKQGLLSGKATLAALGWRDSDRMQGEEYDQWFALQLRQVPESMNDVLVPERGPLPEANGNGNAADGPPNPGVNSGVSRQESRTASARVLGAAELALHRCRELAGVRLRFKCDDCADGQPDSMVAAALGPDRTGDPLKLVAGATDGLHELLVGQGMGNDIARALCSQLERYAARTLFEPTCPALPSGFVASANKALEVSNEFSTA